MISSSNYTASSFALWVCKLGVLPGAWVKGLGFFGKAVKPFGPFVFGPTHKA